MQWSAMLTHQKGLDLIPGLGKAFLCGAGMFTLRLCWISLGVLDFPVIENMYFKIISSQGP